MLFLSWRAHFGTTNEEYLVVCIIAKFGCNR